MTGVVSITAKALGESNWTEQKNSAECRYLCPWRRRPRWIHLTFFARSDGGERCEVGVSLPHLSQFLLLHLEETEHTLMLLSNPPAFILLFGTEARVQRLSDRKIEILAEQVYIWVVVKLEKRMWLVILTLATLCVCVDPEVKPWLQIASDEISQTDDFIQIPI